jgi:hypothetical protein
MKTAVCEHVNRPDKATTILFDADRCADWLTSYYYGSEVGPV